jgi:UDP-2-acetamido-3-amino-2,3-dideoxy-glucuronate N-acetyltransferase
MKKDKTGSNKRICVVGAGQWGKNHVKTLNELGSLGGIVESKEAIRSAMTNQYPHAVIYDNLNKALEAGMDGFVVATPAETHFGIAKTIVENRKPVLVEKPLCLNSKDAKTLVNLARENGVNLMVGHVLLFHPAIRKIKSLIQENKIGKLQYLYSNRLNLGTVRKEENILWSFAPHDISIFQHFIGAMPASVMSSGGAFLQPHIHDTTMTMLNYPDNIAAHIFVSWLHPFKEHRLVIIGSKGMLSFEDSSKDKKLLYYEKGIDWVKGEPVKREGGEEVIPYDPAMPLVEELSYFISRLDGSPVETAGGQSAVEVLEILEKASESLNSVKPVAIEEKAASTKPHYVHPTAMVDDNVRIGKGTKVWHYSHIQSGSVIGEGCSLGQNVNIGNNVTIGNFVKIQNNVSVYEGVELEDYVFCGPSMVFTNIKQPRSEFPQRGSEFYLKTRIKKSASLGANCTIVCGTTVGQYAFVGAGAVVTKDVPDFALVVGNPARFLGWVCMCGQKLKLEEDKAQCGKCRRKYVLESGVLSHES